MLKSLKIHYILTCFSMILAGLSIWLENQQLSYAAIAVISFLILSSDINVAFYTILATVFMWDAVKVNGVLMGFFFSFLFICKSFMNKRNNLERNSIILLVLFVIIFFLNDLIRCTFSNIINDMMRLLLLFACLKAIKIESYNHRYAVFLMITALIITQVFAFLVTGIESILDTSVSYYRIGESEDDEMNVFGGAMEFPIFSIIIMTISLPYLTGNYLSLLKKIGLSLVVLITFMAAMFSASRVFLLGLFVMCCMLFFSYPSKRKILIMLGIVVALIIVVMNTDIVQLAIMRYTFRQENLSDDLSNGRQEIWMSIVDFLLYNPHRLLIGCGYRGYLLLGSEERLPFAGSAHNIILDGIMAYGLFGISVMMMTLEDLRKRLKHVWKSNVSILSSMPFVCWFAMCMTNSTFLIYKTFVLIPFFLLHAYTYKQLIIKENE